MRAKDIMTSIVVSVASDARVEKIASLLFDRHISAVLVVDESSRLAGIVSEA